MTIAPMLLIVEATVDPAIEAEWNRWYDNVHLPEIRACTDFLSGQRYVSGIDTSGRHYVAIYELDGLGAIETAVLQARRGWGPFKGQVQFCTALFNRITPIIS